MEPYTIRFYDKDGKCHQVTRATFESAMRVFNHNAFKFKRAEVYEHGLLLKDVRL